MFLLVWQRTQTVYAKAAQATVKALILGAGYYTSDRIYSYYFGPAHPQSSLQAEPVDLVEWIWAGGTTPTGVSVRAQLDEDSAGVRLAVSENEDMSEAVYTAETVADKTENRRVVSFDVGGLKPGTAYYYAVETDGHMDMTRQGRFRTAPQGPGSFSFAFASCARSGSNGAVYDAIRESDPLFFLAIGDWFYGDISTNNPDLYRAAYKDTLTRPAQAALYRSTSTGDVWDDHDYGGNNGDRESPSREAVRTVYREMVPHYPLPAGAGDAAIYQAFTAGRVRFILTDTRSERSPASAPDTSEKSLLGAAQKEWLKTELLAAKRQVPHRLGEPRPGSKYAGAGKDNWGGYDTERREIAGFHCENDIEALHAQRRRPHAGHRRRHEQRLLRFGRRRLPRVPRGSAGPPGQLQRRAVQRGHAPGRGSVRSRHRRRQRR
jgi:phosphodiesterase/alkaline phosphatase D-like protein